MYPALIIEFGYEEDDEDFIGIRKFSGGVLVEELIGDYGEFSLDYHKDNEEENEVENV